MKIEKTIINNIKKENKKKSDINNNNNNRLIKVNQFNPFIVHHVRIRKKNTAMYVVVYNKAKAKRLKGTKNIIYCKMLTLLATTSSSLLRYGS